MQKLLVISTLLFSASCTGQFATGPGGNPGYATGNGQPSGQPNGQPAGGYNGGAGVNTVAPSGPTGPTGFGNTIDEQKAVAESERVLEEALIYAREKCGLSVLKATIVWTDYLAFKESDFDGRSRANIYSIAGSQMEGPIRQMGSTCGSDAIAKNAVVTKLREIVGHPRIGLVNANNPSHLYTFANGTISLTYQVSSSNTDTTMMLKVL